MGTRLFPMCKIRCWVHFFYFWPFFASFVELAKTWNKRLFLLIFALPRSTLENRDIASISRACESLFSPGWLSPSHGVFTKILAAITKLAWHHPVIKFHQIFIHETTKTDYRQNCIRYHEFSTCAKFSEKLTFLAR